MNYALEYPFVLLLLPLVPCFIYCKKNIFRQYLPKLVWIPKKNRLFNLNTYLKITIFTLFVFALSSPFAYSSIAPSQKFGRDIVLALDTSGSMRESSFSEEEQKKNKFELLQALASDFIDKRFMDNIGIVAYGTFAYTASPITYEHQSLKTLLSMLEIEIAGRNTAIGDAIMQSIHTLSFSMAEEKMIILITDGISNAGETSIKKAVEKAQKSAIRIYTIGLGSEEKYDKEVLSLIASKTGGESYGAENATQLQEVYEQISSLHPSQIRSEQYQNKQKLFPYLLFLAGLLLTWLILREERML